MKIDTKAVLLAGALLLGGAGTVQARAPGDAAMRAAWAERYVQHVCRPLEARGRAVQARRCFRDVARAKSDPNVDFRDVTASMPPVRPSDLAPVETSQPDATRTCAGIACIQRFPMLGISY